MRIKRTAFRICLLAAGCVLAISSPASADLKVGTALVDVTPVQLPAIINGGFLSRQADKVVSPLHARTLVLDEGGERIAIVVVDSCMIPRLLLDDAKALAAMKTDIPADRILISATHTHTAAASMSCLGTEADPNYVPYLRERLAAAIVEAESNLQPARVGFGSIDCPDFTASRRWILRPDRMQTDPFGNKSVRANMHTARTFDDVTGPTGPEDPSLNMIAFQSLDGKPLAVLANFSMHYYGTQPISSDYFGVFCNSLSKKIANTEGGDPEEASVEPKCLSILSHGCSGDIWRRDYFDHTQETQPGSNMTEYAELLADEAKKAYEQIEFRSVAPLRMIERRITLNYRVPDAQQLQWAQQIVEAMGDRPPKDKTEVYAHEAIILHERQSTEAVLQAIQLGDIAIATTPNETYALTGLKVKLQSPLAQTMVIELANGGDGYIPPPEQHYLGGYNTWPARSAGLEVQAEPKIVENLLEMLEQLTDQQRAAYQSAGKRWEESVLSLDPVAFYRLDEFAPSAAIDRSGQSRTGFLEPGVSMFLEGPQLDSEKPESAAACNRAVHFSGSRLNANLNGIGEEYTVICRFWNGMPTDGRDTTGWIFSRGHDFGLGANSLHIGIGGTATKPGRVIVQQGEDVIAVGETETKRHSWHALAIVCDGKNVSLFLDGVAAPELTAALKSVPPSSMPFFFAGRSDRKDAFEGRMDEIAVFSRKLSPAELTELVPKQK